MNQQHPLRLLLNYLMPYKLKLAFAIASSVLNKLCDIVPEILIGISIDVIVNQSHSIVARLCGITDPLTQLYLVGGVTAALWILESVFEYCYLILWRSLAQEVQHTLRLQTYAHLQTLDTQYFENKTTGGLLSILNDDINQLENFLSEGPNAVIQLVINILVMGLIFTLVSPTLALLTVLPIPFVIAMAYFFQGRLAVLYEQVRDKVASLGGHIASRLSGIMTIKSYTAERYELELLTQESAEYKQVNQQASNLNAAYIPLVRMGILVGFIMSLLVGGKMALAGTLSISFYSVLVFLTQRFLWPFTTVTVITDMYERAMASVRHLTGILESKAQIKDGAQALSLVGMKGALEFKNVSFTYATGKQLFNQLSLTIPAHQTVAFVGTTGSGKSTIIKLLLRFYDAQQGSIELDGIALNSVTLNSLRHAIALVNQEVYLVHGTVAQNISYGIKNASFDAVVVAAKAAEAHDFIMALPNGYQTELGENGKNLSGGQRQRLAIARAIFKNPPIFIFDEATSALDNETEAAVQRSIAKLAHQKTMIIVAHRLSTVRHADIIFVMEQGAIVESGTHNALVQKNGTYAALWRLQAGEVV